MNAFRIIVLFVCLFKISFSQSIFAPVGSYFSFNFYSHDGGTTGIKTLYYTNDTIINSYSYKKICSAINYHCICPTPPTYMSYCSEYIFERNDSLFQYFPYQDTLQCLYTFNSNVGDSIIFNSNPPNPSFRYKIVLDSVGTKFICGQNRQTMYYTKYQDICPLVSNTVTVVKGIGPIDDYLFSQTNGCELGIGNYSFNCFNMINCSYPSSICVNEPLGFIENQSLSIRLFITNNSDGIQVHFPDILNAKISVKNILGATVFETTVINQSFLDISSSQLSAGLYLISIISNNKRESATKKAIME